MKRTRSLQYLERLQAWMYRIGQGLRNQPVIALYDELRIDEIERRYPGLLNGQWPLSPAELLDNKKVGYTVYAPIEVEVDPNV